MHDVCQAVFVFFMLGNRQLRRYNKFGNAFFVLKHNVCQAVFVFKCLESDNYADSVMHTQFQSMLLKSPAPSSKKNAPILASTNWDRRKFPTHSALTVHCQCTRSSFTMHLQCTHNVSTMHSQVHVHCTRSALTVHSQCTHSALTMHSQCTHIALAVH